MTTGAAHERGSGRDKAVASTRAERAASGGATDHEVEQRALETDARETPAGCAAITTYPRAEADLRRTLTGARFDAPSFSRRIARCSLAACKGMCCYDGVYVSDDAAEVLQRVADDEATFFRTLGLNLPDRVIVDGDWEGMVAGKKTAVVPHPFSRQVPGFPGHFNDTACVFHLDDGRCGLQVLSEARGRHRWYYKPFTCWLHPISIEPGEGDAGALLLLDDEQSDPYRLPDYDGFVTRTVCGRTEACGSPAHDVLDEELSFLGTIAGRGLAGELRSDLSAPSAALPSGQGGEDASAPASS